jgi:hypothetical protein
MMLLSVEEAATVLGIAPRSVRRWLQDGQLVGRKIGTVWVVLFPKERETPGTHIRSLLLTSRKPTALTIIRQQLRQLGSHLIAIGNTVAGAQHKRGEVFLTWRRPGGLQITFAMGRESPSQGWAPRAFGMELPFWLKERWRWRRVRPLLRRYERLRNWCDPQLLHLPQVQAIVEAEFHRLHTAIEACAPEGRQKGVRQTRCVDDS